MDNKIGNRESKYMKIATEHNRIKTTKMSDGKKKEALILFFSRWYAFSHVEGYLINVSSWMKVVIVLIVWIII